MGVSIHKLVKPDGSTVYRRWDNGCDCYISDELTEAQLHVEFLRAMLSRAFDDIFDERRWARAILLAEDVKKWEKEPGKRGAPTPTPLKEFERRGKLMDELAELILPTLLAEFERRNK